MKTLITGGAGFIGSNLTERLLDKGHEVMVVDNLITGRIDNIERFLKLPNFKFFLCSIESEEFKQLYNKSRFQFDQIYHLACPTGVPNIEKFGDEMLSTCSGGTMNVLNLALDMRAKFLFTSSSEVYGEPKEFPQKENYTGNVDTLGERANYEEGKRFSETLVKRFVTAKGLEGKIVRFFNVYGPNMSPDDSRVISRFSSQALMGKPLTVQGNGSQLRTFCYVSEIIDGLELVMEKGIVGRAYNLGSDKQISVLELAELVIKIANSSSKISFVERPEHDHNSRLPDLGGILALGWDDQISLPDGIRKTLDYFAAQLKLNSRKEKTDNNIFVVSDINIRQAYS